jgi:hypothetical protein
MQTTKFVKEFTLQPAPSAATSGTRVPQWVEEMFAAIDAFDVERFLSFLAPDCLFRFGNAEPVMGHEAIGNVVGGIFSALKGISHANLEAWSHARVVISTGEVTYTRLDESTLTVPFAVVFKLKGTLVQEYLIYADASQLFA